MSFSDATESICKWMFSILNVVSTFNQWEWMPFYVSTCINCINGTGFNNDCPFYFSGWPFW